MTLGTLHCMCFLSARVPLLFLCVRGRIRVIFKCVSAPTAHAFPMRKQVPLGRKVFKCATSCSARVSSMCVFNYNAFVFPLHDFT